MDIEPNKNLTVFDLRNAYQKLYKHLMQYLWDFETVELLAQLEYEIFKAFPTISDMQDSITHLGSKISDMFTEDDLDFKSTYELLHNMIDSYTDAGYELYSVNPIVDLQDNVESKSKAKVKFSIGEIIKEGSDDANSEE